MDSLCYALRFAKALDERLEAAEFVDRIYLSQYGTAPPIAEVYAAVELEGEVVACIGIDLPDHEGLLPIERAYRMDWSGYPLPISRGNKLQFGRWASIDPHAGPLAVYGAACYGMRLGKAYGIVEHDAVVHRRSKLLGLEFFDIPNAALDVMAIREENRAFYSKRTMSPYVMDLRQMKDALEKHTSILSPKDAL